MGAIALAAVGLAAGVGGAAMSANSAKKKRSAMDAATDKWLPNIDQNQKAFFGDLEQYQDQAAGLSREIGQQQTTDALALREQMFPGMSQSVRDAMSSIAPLLRGELPKGVQDAFTRAGGASSVGLGMGGSGFGALNNGLFGARGALGAMQTGFGLLPALMSTAPQLNNPTTMSFLSNLMTPAQRTQSDLQVRGQNIGVAQTVAGMPTSSDVWGSFMQQSGGALMGGGLTAMGGMGGGAGVSPKGNNYGGWSSGGAGAAGWA